MKGFRAGDVVAGKYQIERELGEGGMGFVVAARHLQLGQTVALKFVRADVLTPEYKARFLREARNTVRLKSKHVSRVLDVGALDDGAPYMVMEYLEGTDLSDLLHSSGPIAPPLACLYVMQACDAIAEAHSHGIVHRDLKPANLFLTRGPDSLPIIKVLDFGVSKVLDLFETTLASNEPPDDDATSPGGRPKAAGRSRKHDSVVTRATDLLGSPNYMAPEQILSARDADMGSDIWSLGVILFRLMSGRAPFHATNLGELIQQITHGPIPDLRALRPDLPPGLEQVVARCLERDRSKRLTDARELASLLAPYASTMTETVVLQTSGTPRTGLTGTANSSYPQSVHVSLPPWPMRTAARSSKGGAFLLWAGMFLFILAGSAIFFAKVVRGRVRPLPIASAASASTDVPASATPPDASADPNVPLLTEQAPSAVAMPVPAPPHTGTPAASAKPKKPRPKPIVSAASSAASPGAPGAPPTTSDDDIPATRE